MREHQNPESKSELVDDATPAGLWTVLRYFLDCARADLGAPSGIAHLRLLGPQARKCITDWLAPLEALLRRLLFLDALQVQLPPPPKRPHINSDQGKAKTARAQIALDPERPDQWPARFRLLPANFPARAKSATAPQTPPPRIAHPHTLAGAGVSNAWPLALRYQALIRAIADPAPLAKRLARLLHTRPRAARAFKRAPRPHADWRFGAYHLALAADLAAAAPPFPDTG